MFVKCSDGTIVNLLMVTAFGTEESIQQNHTRREKEYAVIAHLGGSPVSYRNHPTDSQVRQNDRYLIQMTNTCSKEEGELVVQRIFDALRDGAKIVDLQSGLS